ncbi:hypothetical protein GFY24_39610 [Nocardia sp. SYP-A9097]|uniref:hypothetical protein n=1 Tax=Nocardia sp. SYP-A9097 TaxID=2663237 RepID=UPI00129B81AA|nr:hypothetical protein [Nocardia sp. SYP-A9097]MRH93448.1 hypothetical protein [Nocardia sp. SYP-A9097]
MSKTDDYTERAEEWGQEASEALEKALRSSTTDELEWMRVRALQAQAQFCATMGVRDRLHHLSLPPDQRG